ncbi:L-dopachrome tautomerase-related protein [Ochrovirga pacifica]|uniref:L-dopachrome tautomerase-related protein n=1 Tax=Ochrovirga pacifica TaxID=1042376 RepID=UPI0002559FFE|nr:L-dopachrome tautomerase-related protein [Ochrovirga pacifica]
MKQICLVFLLLILISCSSKNTEIKKVASFKGQQVTGVTVSHTGRIFANFPRWREPIKHSVVEVLQNGTVKAFPNKQWNQWKMGDTIPTNKFVAVQSVVAFKNTLYVLDTRNPMFKGVLNAPRIFAFDLANQQLKQTYILSQNSYHPNSYINDLRIDEKHQKMYLTDSGHAGIVVVDLHTGTSFRALDNHPSTLAETNQLTFANGVWKNTVHSDGIALDTKNNQLYFHALTGYSLYAIATDALLSQNTELINKSVKLVAKTPSPDGMIIDQKGNLYMADLEQDKIIQLNLATAKQTVFAQGKKIQWADTFSIYNNQLYYTNSRINQTKGDISQMEFGIYKLALD